MNAVVLIGLLVCSTGPAVGARTSTTGAQRSDRTRRSATDCSEHILRSHTLSKLYVFLTVSSTGSVSWTGQISKRKLELNWYLPNRRFVEPSDYVGIFRDDPSEFLGEPVVSVSPSLNGGYYKTDISFGETTPLLRMDLELEERCLFNYWIAYVRGDQVLAINCIRTRPRWMWDMRNLISSVPVHALMIPGTHNAGAHRRLNGFQDDSVMYRYSVNQEEDIWSQLMFGIRYLDLRVSYYKGDPRKFYLVHDFVRLNPLSEAIYAVKRFLRSSKDLVVMDFHRFPTGFEENRQERHRELVSYIEEELGEFMVPDWMKNSPMEDLWKLNRTLIVSYEDDYTDSSNDKLWPQVFHAWGNKREVNHLFQFINRTMAYKRSAKYLWASMSHLTATQLDILVNPSGGIRQLADSVSRYLNVWYRELWMDTANIVATDFFLSNDIINVAIQGNELRYYCRNNSQN